MSTEETKANSHQSEQVDHDEIKKGNTPTEHTEDDEHRVDTVVPDNDSGIPGPPDGEDSSNTDGGPSEENL